MYHTLPHTNTVGQWDMQVEYVDKPDTFGVFCLKKPKKGGAIAGISRGLHSSAQVKQWSKI